MSGIINPGGDQVMGEISGSTKIEATKIHLGPEGIYGTPVYSGNPMPVGAGDSTLIDAFSRWRVSNPQTIFESKQLFDNRPLDWDDQQTSGSGTTSTYSSANASSTMAVGASTSGTRVRQTFRRLNYEPGKSQLILLTGVLAPEGGQAGNTRRLGLFDANNGEFIQLSGTTLSFVERKGAVDTAVAQSSWNVDKLDGTGPSGITLDVTKTQIFFWDISWLGVGRVRCGFIIGGQFIVAHQFLHSNVATQVYIATPNLPIRFEISNSGTGAAGSLVQICATVISEGGAEDNGFTYAVDTGATSVTSGNDSNIYPLIVLRLSSTKLGSTITPISSCVMSTTPNASFLVAMHIGKPTDFTFAGTALSFSAVGNSGVEVAFPAATNTLTIGAGATKTFAEYGQSSHSAPATSRQNAQIKLGAAIDGTSQYLVLSARPTPAGATVFFGSFSWQEEV